MPSNISTITSRWSCFVMNHSFDIDIAVKYGVDIAIFLNNIAFWTQANAGNKHHYYDGHCWTYNTQEAFTHHFPYWTRQNIRTIIKGCIDNNLLITGKYNKKGYDQTTWYALSQKGFELFPLLKPIFDANGWNQPMEWLELTNALVETNQPIPDTIPDTNTYILKEKKTKKFDYEKPLEQIFDEKKISDNAFEAFWEIYPVKKKKERAKCIWWSQRCFENVHEILTILQSQIEKDAHFKDGYAPNPDSYISEERWKDSILIRPDKNKAPTESYFDNVSYPRINRPGRLF